MILETLVVGPFMSNCYIVGDEQTKRGMVVDPGADAPEILKAIRRLGLFPDLVVLTHSHVDHMAAAEEVIAATHAAFAVHEAEADGSTLQALGRAFGPLLGGGDKLPRPDKALREGDVLEVGQLRFAVLHTPGHTPGGISLSGHSVVFTGDTLFNQGIGRTDFPGCSYDDLMEAIRTKLLTLPEDTKVYPGHGPATTIGAERRWNPFLR